MMVLRVHEQLAIDDLRHHPAEKVERLRRLLARGVVARPDPDHRDFYELEDGCRVFYVNFRPWRRKVLLLATWENDCPQAA